MALTDLISLFFFFHNSSMLNFYFKSRCKRVLLTMEKGIRRFKFVPKWRFISNLTFCGFSLILALFLALALVLGLLILQHIPDSASYQIESEVLSWHPRVFMYHNFLSMEECDHLINLAKPNLKRSLVFDKDTGHAKLSTVRTSSTCFLKRGQDEVIKAIENRISYVTFIPIENGERLQVVNYEVDQKYQSHFDYLEGQKYQNGGQRIATFLMYLSDVEEGGETVFPLVNINSSSVTQSNQLSSCAKQGLAIKPKKGDAILFFNLTPQGEPDLLSLHAGCPVIRGSKWAATKWMHVKSYTT